MRIFAEIAVQADGHADQTKGIAMSNEKPVRRLTLRQLLTQAEKTNRDLAEMVHTELMGRISDFRDLSRPVRRRSHYPAMFAVQNALRKLEAVNEQSLNQIDYLLEH